ncbi:MAG TPA: FtsW/RodA/SpoVE family cell cycle protein, partial [Nitrosospira sp.]
MIYQPANGHERNLPAFDQSLIWSAIFLLSLGLVMVYSASISIAEVGRNTNGSPAYFLVRHGAYLAVGLAAGLIAFQIPMRLWQKYSFHLFLMGVLLLALVLVPGIGHEVNGSRRWISLLIVNFQPSEFMKLFMVIYVANYTVRKAAYLGNFRRGFLPMLIVMLMVGLLLLLEPDFGSFVVITAIMMAILFLGGIDLKLFTGLIGFV